MILFKKNVCFWFLVGFYVNVSWGQCPQETIILETQADINNFAVLYPACTEMTGTLVIGAYDESDIDDISIFSQITSIKTLTIRNNPGLTNLNGLENLTSILESLSIVDNDNLINLCGLENMTSIGNILYVRGGALLNLNGLEGLTSIGGDFIITDNPNLENLSGLENLSSIGNDLKIIGDDKLLDLSGLEGLTSIGRGLDIHSTANLISLTGIENLTSLVDFLYIAFNSNLRSLIGLDNLKLNAFSQVTIQCNPELNFCSIPPICSYVENGGFVTYFDNGYGCSTESIILNICLTNSRVKTNVFYDANQNKIQDIGEPNYYDISILIEPGYNSYQTENIYLLPGNYIAIFDEVNNPNWELTTDSVSYSLNIEEGEIDTITFGIYPTQQISHIETTINSAPARCNREITLDVTTKNLGTTIASGTTWLTIDDAIPEFSFIHQPDTIVESVDTYYGWYFTDLYPGQTITKNVEVTVPGPPDFEIGEQLLFVSFSEFTDANGDDTSDGFRYNPEVLCSYDPNDKLVNPNREGDYVLFEEDLIYTIRFQNTGNDVAYDVVIRDTLDANLDLSTFRVLGSSHANKLNTILNEDEGILAFEFRDIFLPDSTTNLEASQGYVNYLIHTIDGLAEETVVNNSAGIYFDLNPPIITNTTQSIMVSELLTVSTENPYNSFNFNILPNPNNGTFTIQGIPKGTYQILNTSGQIVQQGDMQNDLLIDISREAQGVYFISVTIDNETFVKRMVKM